MNRKYYVAFTYRGSVDIHYDEVWLNADEKANYNTFCDKIDSGLNHYHGYYVGVIISWSLIEE